MLELWLSSARASNHAARASSSHGTKSTSRLKPTGSGRLWPKFTEKWYLRWGLSVQSCNRVVVRLLMCNRMVGQALSIVPLYVMFHGHSFVALLVSCLCSRVSVMVPVVVPVVVLVWYGTLVWHYNIDGLWWLLDLCNVSSCHSGYYYNWNLLVDSYSFHTTCIGCSIDDTYCSI